MKWYDIKWETHHHRAGGMGRFEGTDVEDVKERVRQAVRENSDFNLTDEEIEKLVIEVEEV